jgi:hypothetical protein
MVALGFITAATPLPVIAALTLISGITRSTGLTVYSTVGLADMPRETLRDAATLAATSMQLAAGLAIATAAVALRLGGLVTSVNGNTAYSVAFCLLAFIAVGAGAEALRMNPQAGDPARPARAPAPPAEPAVAPLHD